MMNPYPMRVPSLYFTCYLYVCVCACVRLIQTIIYDTCISEQLKKGKQKKKNGDSDLTTNEKCFDNVILHTIFPRKESPREMEFFPSISFASLFIFHSIYPTLLDLFRSI